MRVVVHAVGRRMPAWTVAGCDNYVRRLPRAWGWHVIEYPQGKGANATERKSREAAAMIDALDTRQHVVALDEHGTCHATTGLARRLQHWQSLGKSLAFVIGGPDGLDERLRERADEQWSLSPLTFPHPVVRVLLAEQLYRAWSFNSGHPYHRE